MRTVCGSEFQTVGAGNRKARLEKSVLMNGLSSSGMVAERKVFGCKRVLRFDRNSARLSFDFDSTTNTNTNTNSDL